MSAKVIQVLLLAHLIPLWLLVVQHVVMCPGGWHTHCIRALSDFWCALVFNKHLSKAGAVLSNCFFSVSCRKMVMLDGDDRRKAEHWTTRAHGVLEVSQRLLVYGTVLARREKGECDVCNVTTVDRRARD